MSLYDDALSRPAWALVRLRESDTVTVVGGERSDLEQLADIPLAEGAPEPGRRFALLVLLPQPQRRRAPPPRPASPGAPTSSSGPTSPGPRGLPSRDAASTRWSSCPTPRCASGG